MTNSIRIPIPLSQISLREEYDDWAILYNPDNGRSIGITPSGVIIWRSLVDGKDINGIIQAMKDEYDSIPDDVIEDIKIFFDKITIRGFARL